MNTAPPLPGPGSAPSAARPAPAPGAPGRAPPPCAPAAPDAGPGPARAAADPPRTLAEVLASRPDAGAALSIARGVVGAVAALHAEGRVHGALHPGTVRLDRGGAVALGARGAARPALGPGAPVERAAFTAPEVLRGGRPGRRADVFSTAALVQAIVSGASPFDAPTALEAAHHVLYRPPAPPGPAVPAALEDAIAAALAKPRWRRPGSVEPLRAALQAPVPRPAVATQRAAPPRPAPAPMALAAVLPPAPSEVSTPASAPSAWTGALARALAALAPLASRSRALAARAAASAIRRAPPLAEAALGGLGRLGPLARAARTRFPATRRGRAVLAVALLALAGLLAVPRGQSDLAAGVAARLSAGDAAGARSLLDAAERAGRRGPLLDKLRGDVACARRASGECLRRYRLALAADPVLRSDPVIRENARRLLGADACGTRRAAAELVGELRDPEALPALRAARGRGGLLAYFCTGDAIDRAIREVRADARP
ncbi:serine/threonine protein kinase [Anaeromyxobacter dehalogenans 2CP-1]|uniref:Serine/threonine protein kinase n=1 Tax=Anaeromyxobacter dehalogenans (strain ATCC BAA-258 / DSM 21875 / 2CP-1) TaxID=455488 RepID=B8J782_ANAD2|nr:serine/threonine protein kinase [Anaeromyxobacter dehalogenans]ACL65272.1 serine/threonine protein kinase [Anaeromyxobacter dehalogenans 2CP-1]